MSELSASAVEVTLPQVMKLVRFPNDTTVHLQLTFNNRAIACSMRPLATSNALDVIDGRFKVQSKDICVTCRKIMFHQLWLFMYDYNV